MRFISSSMDGITGQFSCLALVGAWHGIQLMWKNSKLKSSVQLKSSVHAKTTYKGMLDIPFINFQQDSLLDAAIPIFSIWLQSRFITFLIHICFDSGFRSSLHLHGIKIAWFSFHTRIPCSYALKTFHTKLESWRKIAKFLAMCVCERGNEWMNENEMDGDGGTVGKDDKGMGWRERWWIANECVKVDCEIATEAII